MADSSASDYILDTNLGRLMAQCNPDTEARYLVGVITNRANKQRAQQGLPPIHQNRFRHWLRPTHDANGKRRRRDSPTAELCHDLAKWISGAVLCTSDQVREACLADAGVLKPTSLGLSPRDQECLRLFRPLSYVDQDVALSMMRALAAAARRRQPEPPVPPTPAPPTAGNTTVR